MPRSPPPRLGARESAETRTRAARRGGAPRRCARRSAHARSARKVHASGRTRGCCLGDGAGCRTRSGGGAQARWHRGVCHGVWAARAARAGRRLVCPLLVSGFRSCCALPPSWLVYLYTQQQHPISPLVLFRTMYGPGDDRDWNPSRQLSPDPRGQQHTIRPSITV